MMFFLSNINKSTIVLVPSSSKTILLKEKHKLNKLIDIKVMTIKELIKKYTFDYDNKTIYYLMNKYNIKYKIAKIYLDNLIYIDNSHKLYKIKQELLNNNLLYTDEIFKNKVFNYDIIVYGYDYISKYEKNILNKLNAKIINKKYHNYKHTIYEFNTIEEEINYIANEICKLIDSGIDINNIKICNIQDEYTNILIRIFKQYNIPINLNNDTLYDTSIALYFLDNIEDDINITLNNIKEKYDFNKEKNTIILDNIINILNKYAWTNSYKEVKELLIEEFKHTKIDNNTLKNSVQICNIKDNFKDEDYVFLLSFNQNIIPKIYKDEDYLKDKEKLKYNLETSNELNKIENEIYVNILNSIKNLTITYKLHSYYNDYYISNLNNLLNYEVVKETNIISNYSNLNNKIKLAEQLDNLIKYGTVSNQLITLYNNYEIPYLSYDNSFKGINKDDLCNYIKTLRLSYSSINNYYKCPFKYYISNILKLDIYLTTFEAFVGSVFHNVLSKCFNINFDFDKTYAEAIEEELKKREDDFVLTDENNFFLDNLKNDLTIIIDTIKKQYQNMDLNEALYEKYIEVEKMGKIKITFNGFIDKILIKKDGDITYTAIIDYKTGHEEIDLKNVEFGLNMQLPIYLYLIKNYKEIKNPKIVGFYLQKILNKNISRKEDMTYLKQMQDSLKLEGYSNSDLETIKKLDKNIAVSDVIKGMRLKLDGTFYSTAKVLSNKTIDRLYNYVDKKIIDASDNILDAKFDINPKRIDSKDVSCNFCKFKDICFKREENYTDLIKSDNLEFLGGDICD